jgi:zinc transporter 1/2/3
MQSSILSQLFDIKKDHFILTNIFSHKWTESFALGVSLLKLGDLRKFIKAVAFYTMMVPSGLVLGSILSVALSGETATLTTAILNGIASGTFIYIALVGIFNKV